MNIGWRKDAEGSGKWVIDHIEPKKRYTTIDEETIRWVARWAFHWGMKELERVK